jgi:hypothetical protein
MVRTLIFLAVIALLGILLAGFPLSGEASQVANDLVHPNFQPFSGPETVTPHFLTASHCEGCHGFDHQGNASLDGEGNDVNVHDDWEASMMANAAKDPFWRAKVTHELLAIPGHAEDIQTKCTSCHAPMGHYQALFEGATHYTLADLYQDTVGLDGVSCVGCHAISSENLGLEFSGVLRYDTSGVLYGPYQLPFAAPMIQYVGFEPLYSEHVNDAGICAGCHSLITETFDLDGNPTGETFVEQATYHEWLNSDYESDDISCQSCHMPRIEDPVVISSGYLFLDGRSPYGLHDLVGANTAMMELMRDNRDALGILASEDDYAEAIDKTFFMLQEQSAEMDLSYLDDLNDTLYLNLDILNLAGHKFPSGYPSRRLFVELWVVTAEGDTLFHSGKMGADFALLQEDPLFEPHYAIINADDQVQIYETVAGDVNGDFNTVLEQAAIVYKDNRLPPQGFRIDHPVYDTTRIVGTALQDPNFNVLDGQEGSGRDLLEFRVGLDGFVGNVSVGARLYYQSLPPKWMNPILEESSPEIDTFRTMFEQAGNQPVLVAEQWLVDLSVEGGISNQENLVLPKHTFRVFPNPSPDGTVWVKTQLASTAEVQSVRLWNANGQLLQQWEYLPATIQIPTSGLCYLEIRTNRGIWTERLIKE